ncbi:PAS domain S-box protein, partial [archaeon]|nr:PAS domain S-box protein [archaeon]
YLVDEATGGMDLVYHKGLSPKFVKSASHYDADSPSTRLVMSGKPIYTHHQKMGVPLDKTRRSERLRAIAIIPLVHNGNVIACLNIASHTLDEVPDSTRTALETIVTQMGGRILRKKVEAVLRESEARFRGAFENAAVGAAMVDLNGRFLRVNQRLCRMIGYSEMELLSKTFSDITHPDDIQIGMDYLKKMIAGVADYASFEKRYLHKEGYVVYLNISPSIIRDEDGTSQYFMALFQDITERKKAEKAIQNSEEKYRNLYDSAPDMYHSLDKNGVIVDCNETWVKAAGYEKEEVIGRHLTGFFTEDSILDFEETFPKLNREKTQINLEREYVRKDGSTFIASLNVISDFDDDGKLVGTKTISRDITEHKTAEEEIATEKQKLEKIVSGIDAGLTLLDSDVNVIWANDVMERWFGPLEKIKGCSCVKLYDLKNPKIECASFKSKESGKVERGESFTTTVSGEERYFQLTSVPIKDKNGEITQFVELTQDITHQKIALKALEMSEERHRVVAERTSDYSYAYSVGPMGKIALDWVAGALTKITGFTIKEIVARGGWESLIYPEDMPIPLSQEKDLIEGKSKTVEYRIMNKNGDVRWMMDYAKPEWDEKEKRTTHIFGAVQDITDRKRAEDALKRAYNELKSIDELKSNLIANVSHELRTPLTIVMSSLELARTEENTKDRNELLDTAAEAMMRQNAIVGDLIEAAQIERGRKGRDLKRTEMKKIVDNITSEFAPIAKQQGIDMDVKLQSGLPEVKANEKQLDHILRNLISNAIKFNKKGGKISIEARKNGEFVETSVTDTGIGIPKDKLPKIFDRFYQADSSTSRSYGGTGMGLAVVKEMVEAQGGTIGVESKPGEGSRFYFTLLIFDVI